MGGRAWSFSWAPFLGSMRAPATRRCLSTASRAMNRCMISLEPSKMRLMRESRIRRSTGTGQSLRSFRDSSVS